MVQYNLIEAPCVGMQDRGLNSGAVQGWILGSCWGCQHGMVLIETPCIRMRDLGGSKLESGKLLGVSAWYDFN